MDLTGSEFAQAALAQALQVTAVAVLVALLVRIFARNRPHLAHVLWLVVLVKCLTPPFWSSPTGMFSWMQTLAQRQASKTENVAPPIERENQVVEIDRRPSERVVWQPKKPASRDTQATAPSTAAKVQRSGVKNTHRLTAAPAADRAPAAATRPPATMPFIGILLAGWLAGTLLLASVTTLRWFACWRAIRRAGGHCDPELQAQVNHLARRLKLRRRVKLIVTGGRIGPAVIGLFRPVVLLPAEVLGNGSLRDIEPILAHELIHIRRGDLWVGLLQVAMRCLWWFHPLAWLTSRMLTREGERCCDEEVVAELGCEPARYARHLLAVLELKLQPVPIFPGVRPVEVTSKRLERIMSLRQGCRKRTPWQYRLAMLALAMLTLPGAALVATAQQESQQKQSPNRSAYRQFDATSRDNKSGRRHDAVALSDDQIAVETRIITASPEIIGKLTADWTLFNPNIPADETNHAGQRPQNDPLADAAGKPRNRAQFVVEKNLPVMYHLLDDRAAQKMLKRVQEDTQTNILSCPKCTLFNGQTATIADCTKRPFVVGVEQIGPGALQPRIRVVPEGISLKLKTTLRDKNAVWLDYELKLSDVRSVETTEIKRAGKKPIALQVPEVATYRLDGSLALPIDKQLVVGGLSSTRADGKPESMIVVLSARRVPGEGRLMFGVGANSEAGVTGQIVVDEDNFTDLAVLVESFNDLFEEKRFAEAEIVARQAAKINAELPVVGTMLWKAEFARRLFNESTERAKTGAPAVERPKVFTGQLQPPSDDEVIRELANKKWSDQGGLPLVHQTERDNLRIVKEKLVDFVDPPRNVPLVGPAKAHHTLYRCTVYYTEVKRIGWPVNSTNREEVSEVVYIDKVHFEAVTLPSPPPAKEVQGALDRLDKQREDAISRQLTKKVELNFENAPLSEVMRHLSATAGINIYLDESGLAAEGVTKDTPVAIKVAAPIMVRSALNLILEPLHLAHKIENEVVKVTSEQMLAGQVYPAVYNVADLVVPIPGLSRAPAGTPLKAPEKAAKKPDFDTLIDLITSTVAPDSWDEVGGPGSIEAFETNLSLVVSQTQEVHQQIADLIRQHRRLLDVQVTFEFETVVVDDSAGRINFPAGGNPTCVLSSAEVMLLRIKSAEVNEKASNRVPKVTFFDGQSGEIPLALTKALPPGSGNWLRLRPRVSGDRRNVQVDLAIGKQETQLQTANAALSSGQTVVLDISKHLPTADAGKQAALLITPRIIIQEEEKERPIGRPLR